MAAAAVARAAGSSRVAPIPMSALNTGVAMRSAPLTSPAGLIRTSLSLPTLSVLPSLSATSAAEGAAAAPGAAALNQPAAKIAAPSRLALPAPPGAAAAPTLDTSNRSGAAPVQLRNIGIGAALRQPGLRQGLSQAVAGIREGKGVQAKGGLLNRIFDGRSGSFESGLARITAPDTDFEYWDKTTRKYETEASKLRTALELAMTDPRAAGIKRNLPHNPVYRVDRSRNSRRRPGYFARIIGDDPEKRVRPEDAVIIFTQWALRNISPHFLAAKMASMWMRQLYRDEIPQSAEKTYVEGSIFIRVYQNLTGSTRSWWNGDLDYWDGRNFETYRHFYHWIQGLYLDTVKRGSYFLNKIMHAEGDPTIHTDARGRRTLYQRAQRGEISEQAAERGQEKFDAFAANEAE